MNQAQEAPATKPCPYCHTGTAEYVGLDADRIPSWKCRDCKTGHIAPIPTSVALANLETPKFLEVRADESEALNVLSYLVNDWAGKKGWNDPKTEEQILLNHALARRMIRIAAICTEIEILRKSGVGVNEPERFTALSNQEAEELAAFALMTTEIAEAAEAVITGKQQDDHVPEVGAKAAEMADVLIRIFHFCGRREINLGEAVRIKHRYNILRPYKHGKKA